MAARSRLKRGGLFEEGAPVDGTGKHVGADQAGDLPLAMLAFGDVDQQAIPQGAAIAATLGPGAQLQPAPALRQVQAELVLAGGQADRRLGQADLQGLEDRKSTRLNSSHVRISYA